MIDLLVPYVSQGKEYFEHLVDNAKSLADGQIRVVASYHTEADRRDDVETVYAEAYPDATFYASANHSSAIEALITKVESDYAIFCDSDMAFLQRGWDTKIKRILDQHKVCGVAYPPIATQFRIKTLLKVAPWLEHVQTAKYQNCPNLSFFGITRQFLKDGFNNHLTDFHHYLNSGGFPFRIVSTPQMADAAQLYYGTLQWMDTGYEIPETLYKLGVKPKVFHYAPPTKYIKNQALEDTELLIAPEIFECDGPFLYHFKKGSKKQSFGAKYTFEHYKEDVKWLAQSDSTLATTAA